MSHHPDIIDNMKVLNKTDWLQFHADRRSVTFGDKTYAYTSDVSFKTIIPDFQKNQSERHD